MKRLDRRFYLFTSQIFMGYLLCPVTVLGTWNTLMKKGKTPVIVEFKFRHMKIGNKQ